MAFDPDPPLRAELNAALAALTNGLLGLKHLEMVSAISSDLHDAFVDGDTRRTRRRGLILAVLQALDTVVVAYDALVADGYPTLAPVPIVAAVADELAKERALLIAALAVFQSGPPETGDFNP